MNQSNKLDDQLERKKNKIGQKIGSYEIDKTENRKIRKRILRVYNKNEIKRKEEQNGLKTIEIKMYLVENSSGKKEKMTTHVLQIKKVNNMWQ